MVTVCGDSWFSCVKYNSVRIAPRHEVSLASPVRASAGLPASLLTALPSRALRRGPSCAPAPLASVAPRSARAPTRHVPARAHAIRQWSTPRTARVRCACANQPNKRRTRYTRKPHALSTHSTALFPRIPRQHIFCCALIPGRAHGASKLLAPRLDQTSCRVALRRSHHPRLLPPSVERAGDYAIPRIRCRPASPSPPLWHSTARGISLGGGRCITR